MRCGNFSFLAPVMALAACVAALAQGPTYNMGKTPSAEEIRDWDTPVPIISAEGEGLPPGSGTAKQGAAVFAKKCAVCHGPTATEGEFYRARLVGGIGTLTTLDQVRTPGSFWPFATTLWDYINRAMPSYPLAPPGASGGTGSAYAKDEDRSLSADEVYAVTAFLLYRNGIIQESDVIDAKSLPKVQMPNRNGFLPSDPTEWKPDLEMRIEPHIRRK